MPVTSRAFGRPVLFLASISVACIIFYTARNLILPSAYNASIPALFKGNDKMQDTNKVDRTPGASLIPCDRLTKYVKGIAGVTVWENLYFFEGIFYAVSPDPLPISPRLAIVGNPLDTWGQYSSSDDVFKAVLPENAPALFGPSVIMRDGLTMFFNDRDSPAGQGFLNHYYHFIGEVFLSGWRLVASAYEHAVLPSRLLFREEPGKWRDGPGLSRWIQMTTMPNTALEDGPMLKDMTESHIGFMFEKIVMVDRVISHAWGGETAKWNKMTGNLPGVDAPRGWWTPLRDSLKAYLVSQGCRVERKSPRVPVVTYVNRQATPRRLTDESHDSLIRSLSELHEAGTIEFADCKMEHLARNDQFCQALRTDIMVGVHGNGLSHQLWMRPGGGLLEIMHPPGFTIDYALPAKLLSHQYYAIHNDSVFPENRWRNDEGYTVGITDDFHSPRIPAHGPFIAGLIGDLARNLSSVAGNW